MAKLDQISDLARVTIAQQTAPLLARVDAVGLGAPNEDLVLGPSIQEEMLTLEWVNSTDDKSASKPLSTGQTLSVLLAPNDHGNLGNGLGQPPKAVGYVRAAPAATQVGGAEAWQVTAVSAAALAEHLQLALNWIHKNSPGDPLVRILTVPAFQITALGLYESDELTGVVVVTPQASTSLLHNLKLYAPAEFREILRRFPAAEGLSY